MEGFFIAAIFISIIISIVFPIIKSIKKDERENLKKSKSENLSHRKTIDRENDWEDDEEDFPFEKMDYDSLYAFISPHCPQEHVDLIIFMLQEWNINLYRDFGEQCSEFAFYLTSANFNCPFNLQLDIIKLIFMFSDENAAYHFACNNAINYYYKQREINPQAIDFCIEICNYDINHIVQDCEYFIEHRIGNFPTIERLAIIYEKQKRYRDALEIARIGNFITKSGHENRIARLTKKIDENIEDKSVGIDLDFSYSDCEKAGTIEKLADNVHSSFFKYEKCTSTPDDYVVVDIETTGLNYRYNNIVELGAIKYKDNVEIARFHMLVQPYIPIPPEATAIHGITNEMVKDAPLIVNVINDYLKFIDNNVVVGHNISFDIKFILHECVKNDIKPPYFSTINTIPLARKIYQLPSYSLEYVKNYLGLKFESHRALGDCESANKIYQDYKNKISMNINEIVK